MPPVPRRGSGSARAPPWARPGPGRAGQGSAGQHGQEQQPQRHGFRPLVVCHGECGESAGTARVGSRERRGSAAGARRAGGMDGEAGKERGLWRAWRRDSAFLKKNQRAPVVQVRWRRGALHLSLRIPPAVSKQDRKRGVSVVLLAVLVIPRVNRARGMMKPHPDA